MSRVAKTPVFIPQGVDVAINEGQINVKGALGALAFLALGGSDLFAAVG